MTKREFYKAKFVVELVSEYPIDPQMDIRDLDFSMKHDELVGSYKLVEPETIDAFECIQELEKKFAKPSMFALDDEGNDVLQIDNEVEVTNSDGSKWNGYILGFVKEPAFIKVMDEDDNLWYVTNDQVTLVR